jgi:hypothetical protein
MNRLWLSRLHKALVAAIFAASLDFAILEGNSDPQRPLRIAFFGFALINTSPQPASDAEMQRLILIGEILTHTLVASGRYSLVALPERVKQKIADSAEIASCNGCQIGWARETGADLAVWGTVQKVSNLILNENVYIDDAKTGNRYFARSVDIRGNTDESWVRGMRYLLQHYLLEKR